MLDEVVSPAAAVPAAGGLKVTEDIPGTRLLLNWTGPKPWGWLRVTVPLGVVVVFILLCSGQRGPFALAWEQIFGGGPRDIVNDVILGLIVCFGLYFSWLLCQSLGQFAGYWSALSFEGTEQLLTVERRGWGIFFGRKTMTVLFPKLEYVILSVSQNRHGRFPLDLQVGYRDRDDKLELLMLKFPLVGCTSRGPALEFLLAIGRVIGATGYIATEESSRRSSWKLVVPYARVLPVIDPADYLDDDLDEDFDDEDFDEDEEGSGEEQHADQESAFNSSLDGGGAVGAPVEIKILPIPVVGEFSRDDDESEGAVAGVVDYQLAEQVDIEKINEKLSFARLTDWKPGEHVRFLREGAPGLVFGIAAIFGALVGGGIGGWPVYGFLSGMLGQGVLWWPGTLVLSAVIGGTFAVFVCWNNFQEQTVEILWSDRTIYIVNGGIREVVPFESCRGLLLSGMTNKEYSGTDDKQTVSKIEFGCRLDLLLADRDVQLLQTESWEASLLTAKNLLQPLGDSLAQSLGLKCEWASSYPTDAATVGQAFRLTLGQYVTLGVLLVVAVVGIGRGMSQRKQRVDAGQAVRELGGEAVWLNGFSVKNKLVYKEFWKVEFKDNPQIDAHLAKLHPALVNVPELGIDVESCPLTDAGMKQLEGAGGLRVFTATQTQITDAGLGSLSNCRELVYLNVYGNPISDAGVQHLSGMTKLRYLYIGGTQITDEALPKLGKLPALEYLLLSNSGVTQQGVQKLRAERPALEVDFQN